MFPNGPNEPHLRHAHHGPKHPEAEGCHGGHARRQEGGGSVDAGVVTADAALEDEVFGKRDAFVDGEPVALLISLSELVRGGR